ncbi:DMT family transporter [Sphingomonas changnyeongensis]|uniref:DMT family transporter n=1 Tax=Sphingomonas changnyeongensis TaxID=2698679 RepID=UPI002E171AD0
MPPERGHDVMPVPPTLALPLAAACAGIALFALMDAAMKAAAIAIGAYSAMLWRALIGTVPTGLAFWAAGMRWPGGHALRLHMLRGAITAVMAVLFFWGIARMPLAEAVALTFVAPLAALYLAAVLLGEKVRPAAILGSLLGLAGVGLILVARGQAGSGGVGFAGPVAIICSAMLYAVNLVLMRKQALVARPLEVAFFQNLTSFAVLMLAAPFAATWPSTAEIPLLALSALLATVSLLLTSWAYARAEAQALIAVEYTAFGWAALIGWLAFGERLGWPVMAGTALIIAGCIIAARGQPKAAVGAAQGGLDDGEYRDPAGAAGGRGRGAAADQGAGRLRTLPRCGGGDGRIAARDAVRPGPAGLRLSGRAGGGTGRPCALVPDLFDLDRAAEPVSGRSVRR